MFGVLVAWRLGQFPTGVQLAAGALIVTGGGLVRADELWPAPAIGPDRPISAELSVPTSAAAAS